MNWHKKQPLAMFLKDFPFQDDSETLLSIKMLPGTEKHYNVEPENTTYLMVGPISLGKIFSTNLRNCFKPIDVIT